MLTLRDPDWFWQATWRRTSVLLALGAVPWLFAARGHTALGVVLGGLLLLGDIYLLKAPLALMTKRVAARRHSWVLALGLLRILLVAAVLLVLVRLRIADVLGMLVGVTIPLLAIISLFIVRGLTPWKV